MVMVMVKGFMGLDSSFTKMYMIPRGVFLFFFLYSVCVFTSSFLFFLYTLVSVFTFSLFVFLLLLHRHIFFGFIYLHLYSMLSS